MPLRAPRRRAARPGALKDLSPIRIFIQIVILQFAYYFSALILIVFSALAAGEHPSADLIFGWRGLRGDVTDGWMLGLCWILNSPIAYVYSEWLLSNFILIGALLQSSLSLTPHRSFQACPRLRRDGTRHSPDNHFIILSCHTNQRILVARPNCQRVSHDILGHLELSMARTTTY